MNNILIPTDFSKNSWNAIRYAISYFKSVNTCFYLIHVDNVGEIYEADSFYNTDMLLKPRTVFNAIQELELLKEKTQLLSGNNKHKFFYAYEKSNFIEAVRSHVDKFKIDYIVMGTKGASSLKENVIGSHTGGVITKVKCSVLVVPEKAEYKLPQDIAFPTDFNIQYSQKVLKTISKTLLLNKAALRVLFVSKYGNELSAVQTRNKSFLQDSLESINYSCHFVINESLENALDIFVEYKNIDLITMVAKNLNFFQHLLFKPSIVRASYQLKTPFLILHD